MKGNCQFSSPAPCQGRGSPPFILLPLGILQECYAKEISPEKENLILLNKADLLGEEQRSAWARFFQKEGVRVVFWSALAEGNRLGASPEVRGGAGRRPGEEAPLGFPKIRGLPGAQTFSCFRCRP